MLLIFCPFLFLRAFFLATSQISASYNSYSNMSSSSRSRLIATNIQALTMKLTQTCHIANLVFLLFLFFRKNLIGWLSKTANGVGFSSLSSSTSTEATLWITSIMVSIDRYLLAKSCLILNFLISVCVGDRINQQMRVQIVMQVPKF